MKSLVHRLQIYSVPRAHASHAALGMPSNVACILISSCRCSREQAVCWRQSTGQKGGAQMRLSKFVVSFSCAS